MAKCLPSSWASKADCPVCLQKKDCVLIHLGIKIFMHALTNTAAPAGSRSPPSPGLPAYRECEGLESA
eukprot:scaffold36902_cov21-Tisochrysis_lutea.AAC.1